MRLFLVTIIEKGLQERTVSYVVAASCHEEATEIVSSFRIIVEDIGTAAIGVKSGIILSDGENKWTKK